MSDNNNTTNDILNGVQGVQGMRGTQGIQGIQGEDGYQGVQGIQGKAGTRGTRGMPVATGLDGLQGLDGMQGVQGIRGRIGVQGEMGKTGTQGIPGKTGMTGAQGFNGMAGAQGMQGKAGVNGVQGMRGSTGLPGVQGFEGNAGEPGYQGRKGPDGAQGMRGQKGAQGIRGCDGAQGIAGSDGVQGAQGAKGHAGYQGTRGCDGAQGMVGSNGIQGPQGKRGASGSQGLIGHIGPQGTKGVQGPKGAQGARGDYGYRGDDGKIGYQGITGENGAIWDDGIRLNGYNTHLFVFDLNDGKFKPVGGQKNYLNLRDGAVIKLWLDENAYNSISRYGQIKIDNVVNGTAVLTSYPVYYSDGTSIVGMINPQTDLDGAIEFTFMGSAWYYSGGIIANGMEGVTITNVEVVDLTNEQAPTSWAVNNNGQRVQVTYDSQEQDYVDGSGNHYDPAVVSANVAEGHKYIVITTSDRLMHWAVNDSADVHVDSFNIVTIPATQQDPAHDVLRIRMNDGVTTFDVNISDIDASLAGAEVAYTSAGDSMSVRTDGKLNSAALGVIEDYIDNYDCGTFTLSQQ